MAFGVDPTKFFWSHEALAERKRIFSSHPNEDELSLHERWLKSSQYQADLKRNAAITGTIKGTYAREVCEKFRESSGMKPATPIRNFLVITMAIASLVAVCATINEAIKAQFRKSSNHDMIRYAAAVRAQMQMQQLQMQQMLQRPSTVIIPGSIQNSKSNN